MKVLIIKTSSLGDIIHTLPALTDAAKKYPEIEFHWVVEESFQEIPKWHPFVKKVIPISLRRWRKGFKNFKTYREWLLFVRELRFTSYDYVIDAQGLLKSAFLSLFCKGKRLGLSWHSAREPLASLFYHQRFVASWEEHAVTRARLLFAGCLNYKITPHSVPEYGLVSKPCVENPYFIFLHGTTWATKHWPEEHWITLANLASQQGFGVKVLWGNEEEHLRAFRIQKGVPAIEVMPKLGLKDIGSLLAGATGVVTVDTGLGHLAAALNVETVSLYGPTDPKLNGTKGAKQYHLTANLSCSPCKSRQCHVDSASLYPPCLSRLTPEMVWKQLHEC